LDVGTDFFLRVRHPGGRIRCPKIGWHTLTGNMTNGSGPRRTQPKPCGILLRLLPRLQKLRRLAPLDSETLGAQRQQRSSDPGECLWRPIRGPNLLWWPGPLAAGRGCSVRGPGDQGQQDFAKPIQVIRRMTSTYQGPQSGEEFASPGQAAQAFRRDNGLISCRRAGLSWLCSKQGDWKR